MTIGHTDAARENLEGFAWDAPEFPPFPDFDGSYHNRPVFYGQGSHKAVVIIGTEVTRANACLNSGRSSARLGLARTGLEGRIWHQGVPAHAGSTLVKAILVGDVSMYVAAVEVGPHETGVSWMIAEQGSSFLLPTRLMLLPGLTATVHPEVFANNPAYSQIPKF
jgi:hypothetical protein